MATITPFPVRMSDGSVLTDTPEVLALRSKLHKKFGVGSNEPSASPEYESQLDSTVRANTNARFAHAINATLQSAREIELSGIVPLAAQLDAHIRERIQLGALEALTLLENIVTGAVPASIALRAKYASYLLNCAGYGPLTRIDAMRISQHLTRDDIETLKQRANEASRGNNE